MQKDKNEKMVDTKTEFRNREQIADIEAEIATDKHIYCKKVLWI
jgi:hypothetical protein